MECVPTARVVTASVAMPFATAAVPSGVAPSRKFTEPVGTVAPVMVAVNITGFSTKTGFALDTSPTRAGPLVIVSAAGVLVTE